MHVLHISLADVRAMTFKELVEVWYQQASAIAKLNGQQQSQATLQAILEALGGRRRGGK